MVYLGIDGGGSKTAFVLEDESGQILGRAETGPSNWLSAGKEEAGRNIAAGIRQLEAVPDVVGCGFAGAGRPEGIQFFKDSLSALLPKAQIFVETDAFISYIGAIGLEPGILLIAGTGSIAIGRRRDGSMIRVGGWGPIFGDEGSGFWIGREAIQAALRANDAGTESGVCIVGLRSTAIEFDHGRRDVMEVRCTDCPIGCVAGSFDLPHVSRRICEPNPERRGEALVVDVENGDRSGWYSGLPAFHRRLRGKSALDEAVDAPARQ